MSVLWHGISIGNYGWYNNCECYCCCLMIFMCAWQRNTMQTKDSGHERAAAQKKIMRHVPDATDCAVVASSLYELRSRETKTQLRSPARIKNSILSFCCSCRNLGAYLVSPQHTPQYYPVHTLPSQSQSDAAGCSSVSVSVSVLLDDKINDGNANANYTILIIVFS